jgi:hypothetical protein
MPKAKVAVERHPLASSLSRFGLTMAHVVPLDYLNNVKRIHVKWPESDHHWSVANDCREMFDLLDSILCRGGRLLADINNGKITRSGQCYPGLLYVETANATNHIEVTFEGLCHSGTKVLDLGDEVMVSLSCKSRPTPTLGLT